MIFVWAEREADWHLHLLTTEGMIPYFFAFGLFSYARYRFIIFDQMKNFQSLLWKHFSMENMSWNTSLGYGMQYGLASILNLFLWDIAMVQNALLG